ncbi:DMT family transporter [Marinomonas balearica]|uniref:EamA-like transporter family protein n=1 Tax=Marinomonas balearica TaxID=491947 RepID=A0A4R6M3A8_9GAMM|nr:DMT family transporter [Marinomonas balearica]TDO95768.1 EamA-like transporter family protein [Marinomonas balearica]
MKSAQYYAQTMKLPITEMMLLMVAVVWGTSYGLTKEALVFTGVFTFIALRFGATFLLLLPHLIKASKEGFNTDWKRVVPTGFILLAIFICEVAGIALTSATNAAILISLSMVMTALVESLTSKKWVSKPLIIASVTSVFGVFLLASESLDTLTPHSDLDFLHLNSGDYFILGAALLRAIMVTATKYLTQDKRITSLSMTAIQSAIVSLGGVLCAIVLDGKAFANLTAEQMSFVLPISSYFWAITAYLILFATLFAFFAQNYAVRSLSSTKVALLMGSEPLFGALFAAMWLGESLTVVQMFGAVIIIMSVLYVSIKDD